MEDGRLGVAVIVGFAGSVVIILSFAGKGEPDNEEEDTVEGCTSSFSGAEWLPFSLAL